MNEPNINEPINKQELDQSLALVRDFMPGYVWSLYGEFLDKGFDKEQSLKAALAVAMNKVPE